MSDEVDVDGLVKRLEKWLVTGDPSCARGNETDWTKPVREAADLIKRLARTNRTQAAILDHWQVGRDALFAQVERERRYKELAVELKLKAQAENARLKEALKIAEPGMKIHTWRKVCKVLREE